MEDPRFWWLVFEGVPISEEDLNYGVGLFVVVTEDLFFFFVFFGIAYIFARSVTSICGFA